MTDEFGHWLAGFIDGEACFSFGTTKRPAGQLGFTPRFALRVRGDDRPTLERIRAETGVGTVWTVKKRAHADQVEWSAGRVGADRHLAILRSQLKVRPRRIHDHMKLLATVNRRVAAEEDSVSPFCHVTFIDADREASHDETSPRSQSFLEPGESVPFEVPYLLLGIDLSSLIRRFHEETPDLLTGERSEPGWDAAEINEELKRRP